jgi:L-seryl-tRNA(Ser) seleniumtransferase
MTGLRSLPSVDQFLRVPALVAQISLYGRPLVLQAVRQTLEETRRRFPDAGRLPTEAELIEQVTEQLESWTTPSLVEVINATGVILHTNLGRAPLSGSAIQAMQAVARSYSNLEFNLDSGRRGSRLIHAEQLLQRLTGAEAALVVNNNASAVLLALTTLARRRSVVIARSQLIEIGGGFRIPDVMKQSGARLVEVGTTNRIHPEDYSQAIAQHPAALVMRAHRSNFQIVGFTSEPTLAEIIEIAHQASLPVVDDLGSGTLLDTASFGLGHEPMVQESLETGADLVCFSGDKLLGGPQAGILLGRADLIAKLRKHPLARAIRADKMCLAALSATLLHYLKDEAEIHIPIWRMISAELEGIRNRTQSLRDSLGCGRVIPGESTVGGGSLPGETLPTYLLALEIPRLEKALARLRQGKIPIIARLQEDQLVIDPRTVLPEQDETLLAGLADMLKGYA